MGDSTWIEINPRIVMIINNGTLASQLTPRRARVVYVSLRSSHVSISPFYDNPWVIGIVTGVLSGILLALITPVLLRKRRAREIAIRRERAAEDVLSALRPSVATSNFPTAPMVEAVRRAAAFNRGLDPKLAVSAPDLLDVLASEVLASAFVSPESRIGIVEKLLSLQSALGGGPQAVVVPDAVRAADNIVAVAFAALGACIVGAASAISAVTKDATVLIVAVPLVSTILIILPIIQLGPGISEFNFGLGNLLSIRVRRRREASPKSPEALI
jgi:hypothetical protein